MSEKKLKNSESKLKRTVKKLLDDQECVVEKKEGKRVFKLKSTKTGKNKKNNATIDEINRIIISSGLILDETEDLTARGTPRIRRTYRKSSEISGDPGDEKNRLDAKIGGRVSRELKKEFDKLVSSFDDRTQGSVLTEAIQDILKKYERD